MPGIYRSPAVSCVDLTAEQQAVLDQLASQVGLGPVDPNLTDSVATLREWGWIFGDGPELTGSGWRHATGNSRAGIHDR